jgi:DNA-binding MarR family transcriptional regulator
MLDKQTQKKLDTLLDLKKKNLCRSIFVLYRFLHEWSNEKWTRDGWGDIQVEHLKLVSIIGKDEWNNNEMAKKAGISKQAMSKMVNLLEGRGFIDVIPDAKDSRAKTITISKKGVEFMEYFYKNNLEFTKQFGDIISKEKIKVMAEIMCELAEGLIERENMQLGITRKLSGSRHRS